MDINETIDNLLTTWNEAEAQALWDSLVTTEDTNHNHGKQGQMTTRKLPPRKRPLSDRLINKPKRKPAIAYLKTPPTARIAEKKLQALMNQEQQPTKRHRPHIRPFTWGTQQTPNTASMTIKPQTPQPPPTTDNSRQAQPDQSRTRPAVKILADKRVTQRICIKIPTRKRYRERLIGELL
ncbi:uncharacterized protein LOC116852756 [Odontomachus brunneus]|uniref:uncharacterized protein LOC116852756 n=1 Tax=Odontomachus brunneus TaxID=486640 RepID=UPI0013F1A7EA|nr:uncharacterized protein LOC116852756 [Odontomachus brunneus]